MEIQKFSEQTRRCYGSSLDKGLNHRMENLLRKLNLPQTMWLTRPQRLSSEQGPETTAPNSTGFDWAWRRPSCYFIRREQPRYHNGYFIVGLLEALQNGRISTTADNQSTESKPCFYVFMLFYGLKAEVTGCVIKTLLVLSQNGMFNCTYPILLFHFKLQNFVQPHFMIMNGNDNDKVFLMSGAGCWGCIGQHPCQ